MINSLCGHFRVVQTINFVGMHTVRSTFLPTTPVPGEGGCFILVWAFVLPYISVFHGRRIYSNRGKNFHCSPALFGYSSSFTK